jgi:hypothetical protein
MSITIANQSTVQQFSNLTLTVTVTVAAVGDLIVFAHGHQDFTNTNPPVTVTDTTQSASMNPDMFVRFANRLAVASHSLIATSTGSHILTATYTGTGSQSFGQGIALDLQGAAASSYVDTATPVSGAATSTGPASSGATGTLQGSNDLLICVISHDGSSAGLTVPATGFTELASMADSVEIGYLRQSNSNASVTASYGSFTNSQDWAVGLIGYKAAISSAGSYPFVRKRRTFVPVFYPS